MNDEPVAWAREDGVIAFHKQKEVDSQGFKWFPLYTHPAKTLTDEEIIKVNEDIGTCWDVPHRFAIQIARAILRKVQE